MRKFVAIWLGIIWLLAPSDAEANWEARRTPNGAYAVMGMTLPTRDERHALLIIDFNARKNCEIHAGLNVYRGSRLGAFVSHGQMDVTMYFQTAGLRWSGGKTIVKYTNGFEVMMAVGEDFIEAIKKRRDVSARVGAGHIFEFPGGSNFEAIEVARRTCWEMR